MKKMVTIMFTGVLAAMMTSCGSSATKVTDYIEAYNFEEAYNYYIDKVDSSKKQEKIDSQIEETMDSIYNSVISKYSAGEIGAVDISYIQKLASKASFYSSSEYDDFLYSISLVDSSISAYESGMSEYTNENYSVAISYFEMVNVIDSRHYDEALDKISECKTLLTTQQSENIQTLVKERKYKEALWEIDSLSYTNSSLADSLRSELEDAVLSDIDTAIAHYFDLFDYSSAYNYLNDLYSDFKFESISKKINTLEDDFVSYSLSSAENDASENNYEAASAVVQQAIDVIGDENDRLNSAYYEYRSHLPVYIVDMDYMSCVNRLWTHANLKDNIGNLYHNSLYMSRDRYDKMGYDGGTGEGSADYYIQGKYETFSGTVAVPSGNEGTDKSAYFEVYGDGNLLFTSPIMTNTSFPEEFSIDITGIKVLKISYPESNSRSSMATIYDGLLKPKNNQ